MKVLVTGGSGVIGQSAITELLKHGHSVRLLSRHASTTVKEWPDGVEGFDADVADRDSLKNACDGCKAVIHIAGVVAEELPEITFEGVNVRGTTNIVDEANRANVDRFTYISSLGADRGKSRYHQSKFRAEQEVRKFNGRWLVLRPGNVYGPGDEMISLLLKMVRTLPIIPVVDRGDQPFQPLWHEDLARAIAASLERDDLASQVLELAGSDVTTMDELIESMSKVTRRSPLQLPVPHFLAEVTTAAAAALGIALPLDENKLTMLDEENTIRGTNALTDLFHLTPTPLGEGLRRLATEMPEKLPAEGWGPLREKQFWADIVGSTMPREQLFERFRNDFSEVMPIDVGVEDSSPAQRLEEGATISMRLPLRGNLQVRVEKVTSSTVTLATLEGHAIAGIVRFSVTNRDGAIRFETRVLDRSGSFFDFFAMETVGKTMQDANWIGLVERVIDISGGDAPEGIRKREKVLKDDEASAAEDWAGEIVSDRKRRERTAAINDDSRRDERR